MNKLTQFCCLFGLGLTLSHCTIEDSDQTNELASAHPQCQGDNPDPDGDGWGYENNRSCIVNGGSNDNRSSSGNGSTRNNDCVDDNGDGWGWDGVQSCRVGSGSSSNSSGSTNSGSSTWSIDFNQSQLGSYDYNDVYQEWGKPLYQVLSRTNILEENGNRYLRVDYPRGGFGPSQSGAIWETKFDQKYEELYVAYRVRLSSGFDFTLGGKLPGLAGGEGNTGGGKPNGYDGWSGRIMWRAGGEATQYLYYPDQPDFYGHDLYWGTRFPTGRWVTVETRIKMNTPGQRNGVVESWMNGQKFLSRHDIRFRDTSNFSVDSFQFSTFHGGGDASFAPSKDVTIDFDDFIFSKYPITH